MSRSPKNICGRYRPSALIRRGRDAVRRRWDALKHYFSVGRWGERIATTYLSKKGLIPLAHNWRHGKLEADHIFLHDRTIVVVEVKTRHITLAREYPGRIAITPEKQQHLRSLARRFRRNNGPLCRRFGVRGVRIDLCEVYYSPLFWIVRRRRNVTWLKSHVPIEVMAS